MAVEEKADRRPVKWACITLHPSLPSQAEQIAGARAWGAIEDWLSDMDMSRTYIDDVRTVARTTNWQGKLPMREALITALSVTRTPRNQVFFKSPLCIGFSEKHAADTIEAIWRQNGLVFVQSQLALYREGDDLADLLDAVTREARAAMQRRYRARKSGSQATA